MLRRRRALPSLLAAAVVAVLVLAACSSGDGRALPPPGPDQTTTTPSTPIVPETDSSSGVLELTSASFADGQPLPERFTCNGEDVSPDLAWSGVPADAVELALVVRDRQEAGFVHWVVAGVDPFVLGFGEGGLPENAVEASNGAGTLGWLGPCPAAGSGTHTYELVLHVLPEPSGIAPGTPAAEATARLEAVATSQAVLVATVTAGGTETSAEGVASINEPSVEG